MKKRMEIWTQLTCHGFQGRVMETLETEFFKRKKFNVVEICRKSDVRMGDGVSQTRQREWDQGARDARR
jgi:hypothetical protein